MKSHMAMSKINIVRLLLRESSYMMSDRQMGQVSKGALIGASWACDSNETDGEAVAAGTFVAADEAIGG